jgi:hypothetical protein
MLDAMWIGFLGAVFGGAVGGLFTYLGVKLTLNTQQDLRKFEMESHKKMLLTQLKFTRDVMSGLQSIGSKSLNASYLVYDQDWHKHTLYTDFNKDEFRILVNWFHLMHMIEKEARKNFDGSIAADYILKKFNVESNLPGIEALIEKISET